MRYVFAAALVIGGAMALGIAVHNNIHKAWLVVTQ